MMLSLAVMLSCFSRGVESVDGLASVFWQQYRDRNYGVGYFV